MKAIAVVVWVLASSFFTVAQQTSARDRVLREIHPLAGRGSGEEVPLIERLEECVSLRVQQPDVQVESKSKDKVFVVRAGP